MKLPRASKIDATINMAPLIDVVFLLLSFFMITSTYIKTSAINVDLPKAATSDAQANREAVVTLYKSGTITLNDKTIGIEQLGKAIKDLDIKNKQLVVTIRGDQGIAYGKLIEIMDIVRLTGIKRMSLATTHKETTP